MTEILAGKVGSIGEWKKIYNFSFFPLVQKLVNGDVEPVYAGTGCEKCSYCAVYPWNGFMGMHFCLLCFMETKDILELGKGLSFDGQGCDGRLERGRISRQKRKQLFHKLREKTGNRQGPYRIIHRKPYDPFTPLIKKDVGKLVNLLTTCLTALTKAESE